MIKRKQLRRTLMPLEGLLVCSFKLSSPIVIYVFFLILAYAAEFLLYKLRAEDSFIVDCCTECLNLAETYIWSQLYLRSTTRRTITNMVLPYLIFSNKFVYCLDIISHSEIYKQKKMKI